MKCADTNAGGEPLSPAAREAREKRDKERAKLQKKVDTWTKKMLADILAAGTIHEQIEFFYAAWDKLRARQTQPSLLDQKKESQFRQWDEALNEELARICTHLEVNGETWSDVVSVDCPHGLLDRTYWTAKNVYKAVDYEYDGNDWTDLVCIPRNPPENPQPRKTDQ